MPIITTTKTLRPRQKNDVYLTPPELCRAALLQVWHTDAMLGEAPSIFEPGAGTGNWGTEARKLWPGASIAGQDIRELPRPLAYDHWGQGDFTKPGVWSSRYDLVMGNPPYYAGEEFVRKGMQLLEPGGYLMYLLPLSFLASQRRMDGLYQEEPPYTVLVCGKRPSFTGDRKTDATDYAVYLWMKSTSKVFKQPWREPTINWLRWEYDKEDAA